MTKQKFRLTLKTAALMSFVFGIALGSGIAYLAFGGENGQSTPAGAIVLPALAGANAVDYINGNLLSDQGAIAELRNVTESSGIYLISLDIKKGGSVVQSAEVYATKDGKSLILGNLIDIAPQTPKKEEKPSNDLQNSTAPKVEMFVMSFCPYGKQAENGLGPAARLLGIDVELHFVIYPNYRGGGADFCIESGKYCSMHGIAELNEDIRQLCVYRDYKDKWWTYVDYVNSKCSLQNIESCWKDAASSVGIDILAIESCQKNDGAALARSEFELNQKYGVQGSPTIFINGRQYQGGRAPDNFKSALCSAFTSPPEACGQKLSGSAQQQTASCG